MDQEADRNRGPSGRFAGRNARFDSRLHRAVDNRERLGTGVGVRVRFGAGFGLGRLRLRARHLAEDPDQERHQTTDPEQSRRASLVQGHRSTVRSSVASTRKRCPTSSLMLCSHSMPIRVRSSGEKPPPTT